MEVPKKNPVATILPPPPRQKDRSEEFRQLLSAGDWKGADKMLKQNKALLNTIAADGLSPLQAMIVEGNVPMLAELLKRDDLILGDALLHATEKEDQNMIEMIMPVMKERKIPTSDPVDNTTHFKCYMTPLMLSCIKENYALANYFIKNGHVFYAPHGCGCACGTCRTSFPNGERLEDKMRRIDCYTAASSLAFVLHQDDPFDYAMSFSRYLEKCKKCEPSFSLKYEEMISKLNSITASLIAGCDKQENIEAILNRRHKGSSNDECVFGYPRVQEALGSHHKQFLAQATCLSVVYSAYCGTWTDFFRIGWCERLGRWMVHTLLYPFTCLINIFSCGLWPKSYSNPAARFVTSFASYVTFLAVLIFYTQYKEDRSHLGMPSRVVKIAALAYLYVYLAGMWAIFLTDLSRMGVQRLFDVWWRQFDFVFLAVWTCTLFAYFDAILHASGHGFYDLHRVHWRPTEPQLIYEIWFTWAAIMSAVRLFYYGQVLSHFGVVTISICRCVPTILRYVVVLFVVLSAFAIGLNHLYEHYKDNVVVRDGKEVVQPFQLTSLFTMSRYLYWAYYGYLPPDTWGVIVGNVGHGQDVVEKNHDIISETGELMSGVYHVIELIILLNLMVSIMTAAAVAVVDKELVEWKFVCVEIWQEHFQDSRVIPPPFNLLQLLIHGIMFLVHKCMRKKGPLSVWDCQYQGPPAEPGKEQKYKNTVLSLNDRLRMNLDSAASTGKGDDVAPLATKLGTTKPWMPKKVKGAEGYADPSRMSNRGRGATKGDVIAGPSSVAKPTGTEKGRGKSGDAAAVKRGQRGKVEDDVAVEFGLQKSADAAVDANVKSIR